MGLFFCPLLLQAFFISNICNNKSRPRFGNLSALLIAEGQRFPARGRLNYSEIPGGAVMRVKVTLACTECKQRNYNTMKNKKNDPDRLEMNKYCRFCKKHTLHKETK